jgi:hypothetical protein
MRTLILPKAVRRMGRTRSLQTTTNLNPRTSTSLDHRTQMKTKTRITVAAHGADDSFDVGLKGTKSVQ